MGDEGSQSGTGCVRALLSGILIGAVGTILVVASLMGAMASGGSAPSSELVSANGSVYDERAEMCAIDLIVDVAPSERVVVQNEFPGGSDRTIDKAGKIVPRTVVPADSTVLLYAVNLDSNTSKRLKTYYVTDGCELTEVNE